MCAKIVHLAFIAPTSIQNYLVPPVIIVPVSEHKNPDVVVIQWISLICGRNTNVWQPRRIKPRTWAIKYDHPPTRVVLEF